MIRNIVMTAGLVLCAVPATAQEPGPTNETPKAEAPAAKTPKAETPKAETPKAKTPTPDAPKPATGARPMSPEQFELFERRNPFSPLPEPKPRKPVVPPTKKPDPPPVKKRETRDEISQNLTLTATFVHRSGGKAPAAIVEESGSTPRHLTEGDVFLKGKITVIALDQITVVIDGQARLIKLGEKFTDGTKTHKVYVDTGERVDGGTPKPAAAAASASSSAPKKPGGVSSLLSDAERKLPPAEMKKLLMKRMKERRDKQRAAKGK